MNVVDRVVVLGDLKDNHGNLVLTALELNPTSKSGKTHYTDIIKIATAQGRSNVQGLLNSNIRYITSNKNRVQEWLNVNRLQLPLRSSNLNSTNNIPQNSENSNKNTAQKSDKDFVQNQDRNLVAVHNLTADELEKSLKLGGLAMPSIAVVKDDFAHTEYVTIVLDKRGVKSSFRNDKPIIVRSIVNEYDNSLQSIETLYAVNAKKEPAAIKSPGFANGSLPVTSSTISISDLLDYVNKYYPDILPQDVLKHYERDNRPKSELSDSVKYQDRESLITDSEFVIIQLKLLYIPRRILF